MSNTGRGRAAPYPESVSDDLVRPYWAPQLNYLRPETPVGLIFEQIVTKPGVTSAQLLATAAWEALQPATASRAELAAFDDAVSAARERVRHLSDLYWRARRGTQSPAVEVLHAPPHIHTQFLMLQRDATQQIRAFDRPPYLGALDPELSKLQVDLQTERMQSGVTYRVIYQRSMWQTPQFAALTSGHIARGEKARQMHALPMKLTIMDATRALVSLEPYNTQDDPTALLIHPSALLNALIEIFEKFWHDAYPVETTDGGLRPRDRHVLRLMAEGATDERMAHQLGVSHRTITRIISDLHMKLGAETRFQIALNAMRRGFL